jgi:hypothetical protein
VLGGWFDGHILADWRWRLETFCGIVQRHVELRHGIQRMGLVAIKLEQCFYGEGDSAGD